MLESHYQVRPNIVSVAAIKLCVLTKLPSWHYNWHSLPNKHASAPTHCPLHNHAAGDNHIQRLSADTQDRI